MARHSLSRALTVAPQFNRVKEICSDVDTLVKVCQASPRLRVVGDAKVTRSTPWPTEDTSSPRTVLVKNVPATAELDHLLTFFAAFGAVNAVRPRKGKDRQRKDSVWVEFASPSGVAAIVAKADLACVRQREGVTRTHCCSQLHGRLQLSGAAEGLLRAAHTRGQH